MAILGPGNRTQEPRRSKVRIRGLPSRCRAAQQIPPAASPRTSFVVSPPLLDLLLGIFKRRVHSRGFEVVRCGLLTTGPLSTWVGVAQNGRSNTLECSVAARRAKSFSKTIPNKCQQTPTGVDQALKKPAEDNLFKNTRRTVTQRLQPSKTTANTSWTSWVSTALPGLQSTP